jgi:hypothetical protein
MKIPKNFPQKNMFSSTRVGNFQGAFFRKILHGCRKMSHFVGPHLYIIYILKDATYLLFRNKSFQLIYVYVRQIYVRFPEIFTICPHKRTIRAIPIAMIFYQTVI